MTCARVTSTVGDAPLHPPAGALPAVGKAPDGAAFGSTTASGDGPLGEAPVCPPAGGVYGAAWCDEIGGVGVMIGGAGGAPTGGVGPGPTGPGGMMSVGGGTTVPVPIPFPAGGAGGVGVTGPGERLMEG